MPCRLGGLCALLLAAPACDDPQPATEPAALSPEPAAPEQPVAEQYHDFGLVPHGRVETHDFEFAGAGIAGLMPIGFRTGCSCAGHRFLIRSAGGEEREVTYLPAPYRTVQASDTLILRLSVDTTRKEPVDLAPLQLHGEVLLVPPGEERAEPVSLPVRFRYGIDSRIGVMPFAHVDFGALPRCRHFAVTLELHRDPGFEQVVFGPAVCDDPRVSVALREEDGLTLLDVGFRPDDTLGTVRTAIRVSTDPDNGYVLVLPLSGQVIDDVVVEPGSHVSFGRIDLRQPAERFVNVTDYRTDRPPGFEVRGLLDTKGVSLAEHFEVRMQPIAGEPRATRVVLRYLGTLPPPGFRGVLRLAKPGGPTCAEITFVGFSKT